MIRILVVHGAGIELRGKVDIQIFGAMTMEDYNVKIADYARELGIEVETFHSLDRAEVVAKLTSCKTDGIQGVVINPATFTLGHPDVSQALQAAGVPSVEVHLSNPARRSVVSEVARVTDAAIAGFGVRGYYFALHGLKNQLSL